MTEFIDPSGRLDALVQKMKPKMRRRFIEVVRLLRNERTLAELADMISTGQIEEALISAQIAALRLGNTWGEIYITSGTATGNFVGNSLEAIVDFDRVNNRAMNVMQQNQLRLIREFVSEQRRATRQAIASGIERGMNPRQLAREFKQSIGLTSYQQQIVSNYRTQLETLNGRALGRKLRDGRFDSTVRRAIEEGKNLTTAQIDNMVARYSARFVSYRSEVIARTESLRAVHQGSHEMYSQAVENGDLDITELQREWDTAEDGRERDTHRAMDGQRRGLLEPFVSPSGATLMQPGDSNAPPEESVQCRCAVQTRFTDSAKQRTRQLQSAAV